MSHINRIEGIFRLKTPLHCAAPGEGQGNETRTMTMPIITRRSRTLVPFFPGNDLRGRLRRKAARHVMEAITQGKKISRELYTALTCGSTTTHLDANCTVEEVLRARDNIYMGVFGGGPRMLRSRFQMADLVPVLSATVDTGTVPKQYAEAGEAAFIPSRPAEGGAMVPLGGFDLLATRTQIKVDDAARVLHEDDLNRFVENVVVELAIYQEAVLQGRKDRKEDKAKSAEEKQDVKKKDVGNMYTVQAIAPGTPMYFRLDMEDTLPPAQTGLLLQSLLDLVNEQGLGGWSRCGFGRYAADLALVKDGEHHALLVQEESGAYRLAPAADVYLDAMRAELAGLTAEAMADFFLPRGEGEGKKPRGKKAA